MIKTVASGKFWSEKWPYYALLDLIGLAVILHEDHEVISLLVNPRPASCGRDVSPGRALRPI